MVKTSDALERGECPHPAARNLLTRNYTLRYHMVKTWSVYISCRAWFGTGLTDEQTDRRADGRTELQPS